MGRFTFLEKNLVVAATDLPDADDTANHEKPQEHYSKTHVKAGIYGLDRIYTDDVRANEELRFYVDAQWSRFVKRNTNSNSQTKWPNHYYMYITVASKLSNCKIQ